MAQTISQRELRNDSGKIMRRLDQGDSFVITRNGPPVCEPTTLRRQRFVSCDAVSARFSCALCIDFDRFRADLDAHASQEIDPRG